MARLNPNQIVSLFAQRLPATGGWLSVKQAAWLFGVAADERGGVRSRSAGGNLEDGRSWSAHLEPNGAALLTIGAENDEARRARFEREDIVRAFNEEVSRLMLSGDLEGAKAYILAHHPGPPA